MGDADLLVPASALATDRAWAIVRRLAESNPLVFSRYGGQCHFCKARVRVAQAVHAAGCVWQNAREVLDADRC